MRKFFAAVALAVVAAFTFGTFAVADACAAGDCGQYVPRCKYGEVPWRGHGQALSPSGAWAFPYSKYWPWAELTTIQKDHVMYAQDGILGVGTWYRFFYDLNGTPVHKTDRWEAINMAFVQDVLAWGGATGVPRMPANGFDKPSGYGYYDSSATRDAIRATEVWWNVGDKNGSTIEPATMNVINFIAALQANEC